MKRGIRYSVFIAGLAALAVALTAPALALLEPEQPQTCEVTFHIAGSAVLGALEARVDYSGAGGAFEGIGSAVACVAIVPGAFAFAVDNDEGKELSFAMMSVVGAALPQDFWRCSFVTSGAPPSPDDFVVTVDEALDTAFARATVSASVNAIACANDAVCGNAVVEGDEQCDEGTATPTCSSECRFPAGVQQCQIGFRVDGTDVLGSLQFSVGYAEADGDFAGTGETVACTATVESALTALNDRDADRELRLGLVSPNGFTLPLDLWECSFLTTTPPPLPADFVITAVQATDLSLATITVDVSAGSLGCAGDPDCGNGRIDGAETCDDGNTTSGDGCNATCDVEYCGDGIDNNGAAEQCDDGNTVNTDVCTNACAIAVCGDGIVRAGVETCDDGNTVDTDACTNACAIAVCGDGIVRAGVETCDDGNTVDSDACSNQCEKVACGDVSRDGRVSAGDALQVLKAAVGLETGCTAAPCVCDANGDTHVKASDALLVLRAAVGQSILLACPC